MDNTIFDLVLLIVTLAAGIFCVVKPEKAYNLLQTKKHREAFTDKIKRTTMISGIVLIVLSIVFVVISFII